jgi:ribose 5-phosphate isomerase A
VGLGTGSTAGHFITYLAERVRSGQLKIHAVASSVHSEHLARQAGIPVSVPKRGLQLDLTVDGADEISYGLDAIKGGGGALLREKAIALASKQFVIIVDSSKLVTQLGSSAVPVEAVPFTVPWVMDEISNLKGNPTVRTVRESGDTPFLTDQQNYILDVRFDRIEDIGRLACDLKQITGVVEHGLFLNACYGQGVLTALVADGSEIAVHRPGAPATAL